MQNSNMLGMLGTQQQPVNLQNVITGAQGNYSSTQYPQQQNNAGGVSNQSPFLDYQKYLEEEKRKNLNFTAVLTEHIVVFQNQKAKSHLGYYNSVGPTPQNVLMQNMIGNITRVGQQV